MTKFPKPPLSGLSVLELTASSPATFCTLMLADMGADVVKVEPVGDRRVSATSSSPPPSDSRRQTTTYLNRGKRSLTLNLKSQPGRRILRRLIAKSDVVVEGFRPGVMARLGLDYKRVRRINARLIFCSMSGYGQSGPYSALPGHDLNFLGQAGVLSMLGAESSPPVIPLNLIADYGGAALHAVSGILLALLSREKTGLGQMVDVAYLDSTLALLGATPQMARFLSDGIEPTRGVGIFCGGYAYYSTYETRDGRALALACLENHLWTRFCDLVRRPNLKSLAMTATHITSAPGPDQQQGHSDLSALFRTKSQREWMKRLLPEGVCVSPLNTISECIADPQLSHRGMIETRHDREAGDYLQLGVAIKLSRTPGRPGVGGPTRGQHTKEILKQLGFDTQTVARFRAMGTI